MHFLKHVLDTMIVYISVRHDAKSRSRMPEDQAGCRKLTAQRNEQGNSAAASSKQNVRCEEHCDTSTRQACSQHLKKSGIGQNLRKTNGRQRQEGSTWITIDLSAMPPS